MPAGGDIIELVHEQSYLGQQVNNVYYFEAAVQDASMEALATWFEDNVVPAVKAIQNDLLNHLNLRLRNLFNDDETLEEVLTGSGALLSSDVELPSFFALELRLDHETGTLRPGFKRWGGINEGSVTDAVVSAGTVANMTNIGDLLINPPAVANPDWAHVVVGRVCAEPNPDPEGVPSCLRYRLPETQAEAVVGYPVIYEVFSQPTTQNSRKWYT